jgi:hypothetical protein
MKPVLVVLIALGATIFAAGLRIGTTLRMRGFDAVEVRGQLRSDPALLVYLTERVVEAGASAPEDWRADRRIEHPDALDVPATFTVGQEFLIAWARRHGGDSLPLHVLCVWVAGITAALTAGCVVGMTWELTRSVGWSFAAALLCLLSPASYRSLGFVLVREDLSLPLFALHLFCLARAVRVQSTFAWATSGLALAAALATWHAMSSFVLMEGACAALACLITRRLPFTRRASWAFFVGPALAVLAVPALRAKLLAGEGDLTHVREVLFAKLLHLGHFPDQVSELSFDARLLWQGPFETLSPTAFPALFQLSLWIGLPAAIVLAWRARHEVDDDRLRGRVLGLSLFTLLTLLLTWLVARVFVLPAILLPVLSALGLSRLDVWRRARLTAHRADPAAPRSFATLLALLAAPAFLLALLLQVAACASWRSKLESEGLSWNPSASRRAEIVAALEAVETHVPASQAVAADFMLSPAILAHTGRPIVLQPKWETRRSRERVRLFWQAFYRESPESMRRLLVERFDCRWLLVDRTMLWTLRASRRLAGLRDDDPPPAGSLAEALFTTAAGTPPPGFESVWEDGRGLVLLRVRAD